MVKEMKSKYKAYSRKEKEWRRRHDSLLSKISPTVLRSQGNNIEEKKLKKRVCSSEFMTITNSTFLSLPSPNLLIEIEQQQQEQEQQQLEQQEQQQQNN